MSSNNTKYGHNQTTKRKPGWDVKESVTRPETNSRERVDVRPEAFDRLINQKGVMARIYRTLYCPNVKSVDGAEHEIDCTLCNGSGFIDVDPICCHVYIQTQDLHELPNIEGFLDGNTISVTFPAGVEVQYFTKIELHDFTDVFPQRVLRKRGTLVDILKYPACRVNVLLDRNNVRYHQGIDFILDANGNVKWLSPGDQQLITFGAAPDGGSFTITKSALTTAAIPFDADADAVQAALRALEGLETVTVSGDFLTGFLITFVGIDSPVALATTDSELTLAAAPVVITVADASRRAKKPNDNKPYAIHYEARTQYRAKAAIHSNRFTQVAAGETIEYLKMQEQWYCTKEFLIKRTDKESGAELQQGPFDNHSIVVEDGGDESN